MLLDYSAFGAVDEVAAGARHAEDAGYDGFFATEINHDPFLPLAIAATATSRVQLGTAIAVAFARSPMTMALTAHDLQQQSGGRFVLGLGTQVRAHIVHRYSMPWSQPVARMREYVLALRAIWDSWATGEALDFRGEFYRHTLMRPLFTPERHTHGPPKILIAAVGPKLTAAAAELADGLFVHTFTTSRYLRDETIPTVEAALRASGRRREDFQVSYPALIVTGRDEGEYGRTASSVKRQIAFYGSTPAYRRVLELHGWGDLHVRLHELSQAGDWKTMTELIDDDMLNAFAVCGPVDEIAAALRERFDGLVDRLTLLRAHGLHPEVIAAIAQGLR